MSSTAISHKWTEGSGSNARKKKKEPHVKQTVILQAKAHGQTARNEKKKKEKKKTLTM